METLENLLLYKWKMNAKPTDVLLCRELFSTLPVWTWDRNGKHPVMHQESLKVHGFIPGFLNSSTINIFGLIILCCEGLSFHCMTFSSISILYSLDSSSITTTTVLIHVLTNQKCLQTFPNAPWSTKLSLIENHCSIQSLNIICLQI